MCLAIYKPAEAQVDKALMKRACITNSDGMGIVTAVNGQMIRFRSLNNFDEFYTFYKEYEKYQMLIHFRMATHGKVCEENIHPFHVRGNLFMCHNGTFSTYDPSNEKSDTRLIAEKLAKISNIENVLRSKIITDSVGITIGNEKVILMDDKDFYIYNESRGIWKDDVWYSHSGSFGTHGFFPEEDFEGEACRTYVLVD
jgi:predicted glutamine amidotransferase